ncbi:MAG TPA: PAS domain S-box protein [Gemmatimonadaceae bacterium]|nr:PAS domain S-box protein [Gemmatimonadaceae bacterium]
MSPQQAQRDVAAVLLRGVVAAIEEVGDVAAAIRAIVQQTCYATGWVYGEAWMPHADAGVLERGLVWHGTVPGLTGFGSAGTREIMPHGHGFVGRAWASRRPVWTHDLPHEPDRRASMADEAGLQSAVAIPVMLPGDADAIAVLAFYSFTAREDDERHVEAVAAAAECACMVARSRESERSLRASEERFRTAAEGSLDAIALLDSVRDPEGRIVDFSYAYLNGGAEWLLGMPRAWVMGQRLGDILPSSHTDGLFEKYVRAVETGQALEEEFSTQLRGRGGPSWIHHRVVPLADGAAVTARDLTERRRAEETLRESEERFRAAFGGAPIGMALVALDGRWLQVNQSLCEMLGYGEDELLATTFQAITHPDDLNADLAELRRMLAGEIRSYQMEKRYLHKRGYPVRARLSVSLVRGAQRQPRYFVSQIEDIGARQSAESEGRLRLVEASRGAFFYSYDRNRRLLHLSPSAQALTGYSSDELVGRSLDELLTDAGAGGAADESRRAVVRRRDGRLLPVEIVETTVRAGGGTTYTQGFAHEAAPSGDTPPA